MMLRLALSATSTQTTIALAGSSYSTQHDDRHGGAIAQARLKLDDPRVAALAVGIALGQSREQLLNDQWVIDMLQGLPAIMDRAAGSQG